jgi:hypothetical protein
MITLRRTEVRAAEYRANADIARAKAEGSLLQNVREGHEAALATWLRLAELEERRGAHLSQSLARGPPSRTFKAPTAGMAAELPYAA